MSKLKQPISRGESLIRAAIYARYSSDLQRDASIEDHVRLCKARITTEKWVSAGVYTDPRHEAAP